MQSRRFQVPVIVWQLVIVSAVLLLWEYGNTIHQSFPNVVPDIFDPYFISQPSEIASQFLTLTCLKSPLGQWNHWSDGSLSHCLARHQNNLWVATAVTLKNTLFGFIAGISSGFLLGLVLGRSDRLSRIFGPFVAAVNSIPPYCTCSYHHSRVRYR